MGQITEIRHALRDIAREVAGEQAIVTVFPARSDYEDEDDHLNHLGFTVRIEIGPERDEAALERLDELLELSGPTSVKAAIASDDDLGGLVGDLRPKQSSGYRTFPQASGERLVGADWQVDAVMEPQA